MTSASLSSQLPNLIQHRKQVIADAEEYKEAVVNILNAESRIYYEATGYALYKLDIGFPIYQRTANKYKHKV